MPKFQAALFILLASLSLSPAYGKLEMSAVFSNNMVLQRDTSNLVWGQTNPGDTVTVNIDRQSHQSTADGTGNWRVNLDPLPAGGPHTLTISTHRETREIQNVLIGEVWICSGQSNMYWSINDSNDADLEKASAHYPEIRIMTLARNATQVPQMSFQGRWKEVSPQTVGGFSAIGYHFGRRLHTTLNVPIGLITNAWNGSAAEAWVPRDFLGQHRQYRGIINHHERLTADYTDEKHAELMAAWETGDPKTRGRKPRDPRYTQHRPGNIFNGMVHPLIGYGIRGIIWYQGETNVSRSENYTHLMKLLITTYREMWGLGDFSFYWVQLADHQKEQPTPNTENWALLRDAQTALLDRLPSNTGQAIAINTGEARDIHPRDKLTVANRLVRHALAKDYGHKIDHESPRFESMQIKGNKIIVTFQHVSERGLYAFDSEEVKGFAIAGADKKFVWADANIINPNQVEVSAKAIPAPMAVRYAFQSNPVCNLYDRNGLPVTPFRAEGEPHSNAEKTKPEMKPRKSTTKSDGLPLPLF